MLPGLELTPSWVSTRVIMLLVGGEGEAYVAWMGAGSWLAEYQSNPSPHWWRRRGKRCLDVSCFLVG